MHLLKMRILSPNAAQVKIRLPLASTGKDRMEPGCTVATQIKGCGKVVEVSHPLYKIWLNQLSQAI